jgi:hypothetical protein
MDEISMWLVQAKACIRGNRTRAMMKGKTLPECDLILKPPDPF